MLFRSHALGRASERARELITKADGGLSDSDQLTRSFGSPAEIGRLFLTDHLLAFEITSIILLIAAVGGVVLGMKAAAEDDA